MKKKIQNDELLNAVSRIINTKGVSYLTLENVANEAGVSKGGLLHYFPNKKALIEGGITSVIEKYTENLEKSSQKDSDPGHTLRAYIEVSMHDPDQLTAGLLAAIATDPELLKPLQDHYAVWQRHVENDGLDPVFATIIRLAIDGLWFCDMFGLTSVEPELREKVLNELVALTRKDQL
ncbi:TetR family transcriptional regulator [Brevibacillus reuszeri]|uniref:TetR family transcriptional regulator n=1 Tax=Brevibacillus reuszeri TaxID=54915 RepID=A0A0K9YV67_9BACL|nr:TetR/AcrR family transcriptional regulator [Brevibacillus reuszeri]KNB72547.1 hypothetical protein ADS79_11840 [Brevibacillus reuszeri]MED1860773.1 TetR/AcrR family transcriptional regulator [Brevibacillus reuszeri]GED70442.1 TetR family transcriptional regulator [Brevibacillus reuszeri]